MIAIDWNTVANVATAAAAVLGALTAVHGVKAWKRELRGKEDHQLAKRIITSLFAVRDKFGWLRFNVVLFEEVAEEDGQHLVADVNKQASDVFKKRWNDLLVPMGDLYAALLEAEALWGDPFGHHSHSLQGFRIDASLRLHSYLLQLGRSQGSLLYGYTEHKDRALEEAEKEFFGAPGEDGLRTSLFEHLDRIEADTRNKLAVSIRRSWNVPARKRPLGSTRAEIPRGD